jgi:transposase InsO family protein
MAFWRRRMPKGVLVHSDRGSKYCSWPNSDLMEKHKLLCSMSAKGNCYDNACAESSFHTLKLELIQGERFATRGGAMRQIVFEYLEIDYN